MGRGHKHGRKPHWTGWGQSGRATATGAEREQHARRMFENNPDMPIQGPLGIIVALTKDYGAAIPAERLFNLRAEVRQAKALPTSPPAPPPMGPPPALTVAKTEPRQLHATPEALIAVEQATRGVPVDDSVTRAQRSRESLAKLPPGYKSHEQRERRMQFAREFFRKRPNARVNGEDSCSDELTRVFGVSLSGDTLSKIKAEVNEEVLLAKHGIGTKVDTAVAPVEPAPILAPSEEVQAANLQAAAQLVVDSVPGLRRFTVDVADDGSITINVDLREVRVVERTVNLSVPKKA